MFQDSPLARKLGTYVALSEEELLVLSKLHRKRRSFEADHDLVHQGEPSQSAYILAAGWVCSYKLLPDGTRQIVDFQIPGDLLGFRSFLLRVADHNIQSVTKIEVSAGFTFQVRHRGFEGKPRLASGSRGISVGLS